MEYLFSDCSEDLPLHEYLTLIKDMGIGVTDFPSTSMR